MWPSDWTRSKGPSYYSPSHDAGVLWNDPALEIEWPVKKKEAILSTKDEKLPLLVDVPSYFTYGRSEMTLCES